MQDESELRLPAQGVKALIFLLVRLRGAGAPWWAHSFTATATVTATASAQRLLLGAIYFGKAWGV